MIKGGHAPNQVPDHAEISIDMRFTNDADKEKILDFISTSQGIGLKILTDAKFLNTENNLHYVLKLKQSANRILGRSAKLDREEGASDARHFADRGIPSVLLWPIGHHAHSENEYVDIKSLVKLYNILKNFIDTSLPHY
jgi:succinyl-diaminopimelate desuccinylase